MPLAVIDLSKGEKCCGMILVALLRVRKLKYLLLKPFSMERLHKVNRSPQLEATKIAIALLEQKAQVTTDRFNFLLN